MTQENATLLQGVLFMASETMCTGAHLLIGRSGQVRSGLITLGEEGSGKAPHTHTHDEIYLKQKDTNFNNMNEKLYMIMISSGTKAGHHF